MSSLVGYGAVRLTHPMRCAPSELLAAGAKGACQGRLTNVPIRQPHAACLNSPHEKHRLSLFRSLDPVAAIGRRSRRRTRCCNPSISRSRPRRSAPTAPISGCIISPASSARRFRCWRPAARGPSRIEIGTAVIDMRYENPLYMAEDAGAADLIAGGRLQLGISRGSPEQVIDGWRYFGYVPQEGQTDADMARTNAEIFLELLQRPGLCQAQSAADVSQSARPVAARAVLGGLARAHLVGRRHQRDGGMGGQARHEPAVFNAEVRRERQAVPRPAGRADPAYQDGLERGRAHARRRASRCRADLRAGRATATGRISARRRERGSVRFIERKSAPSSAAAMPPSRTR